MNTQTILVSNVSEALTVARKLFAADSECEWVVAEGDLTLGGVMFAARGALVMHRSERAAFTHSRSVEETKQYIIARSLEII